MPSADRESCSLTRPCHKIKNRMINRFANHQSRVIYSNLVWYLQYVLLQILLLLPAPACPKNNNQPTHLDVFLRERTEIALNERAAQPDQPSRSAATGQFVICVCWIACPVYLCMHGAAERIVLQFTVTRRQDHVLLVVDDDAFHFVFAVQPPPAI